MNLKKNVNIPILTIILIIFYVVGTVGLLNDKYNALFLSLSFYNLLLTFVLMLLGRKTNTYQFYLYLIFAMFVAFTAEYIGTTYNWLFGSYQYGENLGYKLYNVPVIIAFNWAILIVSSASIASYVQVSNFTKAIIAAALMTGLDYFIEPIAMKSDYWSWENNQVPIFNYITWFLLAFLLQYLYFKFKLNEKNSFHATIFIVMALFFIILNIY